MCSSLPSPKGEANARVWLQGMRGRVVLGKENSATGLRTRKSWDRVSTSLCDLEQVLKA